MEIKDLQPRAGKVDIAATVISKDEPRQIEKPNFSGKVCNATIKDDSGEVKITLWNEQCDQVGIGDKIKISNGYVGEWQGEMQLSTGKFGSMEVLEKSTKLDTDKGEHILTEDEKTESNLLAEEGEKTDEGEHILTDDEKQESDPAEEKPEDVKVEEEEI
jgi:replication factor A1